MPKEFSRSQRMAEQVRRELALMIQNESKDPRLELVSITAVKMSRDLSYATVYCTVLDNKNSEESVDTLNKASGYFRRGIAGKIKSRIVPVIKFVIDDSVKRGAEMEKLINAAINEDKSHTK